MENGRRKIFVAERLVQMSMRAIWFVVGAVALSLGMLGVFLPLLPTTPFILLAAYAFARSSERWHNWLIQHRVFGPMIENWRQHGAISRRAKITAVISIVLIFGLSVVMKVSSTVLIIQGLVLTCVTVFVLSRPLPPQPD